VVAAGGGVVEMSEGTIAGGSQHDNARGRHSRPRVLVAVDHEVRLSSGGPLVKAAVYTRYGPPEVVRVAEVAKPVPGADELLVKVHATTVNRTDCGARQADPVVVRLFTGLTRPRHGILGSEFAGEVEAVGRQVRSFAEGDAVFGLSGDGHGTHAEYVCVSDSGSVARKPSNMPYEQAAATCDGAMLALRALRRAGLQRGQRILVNGASGSIGTAAVQLAKHFGAEITAVCGAGSMDLARSLGADRVIDYTSEDFTKDGQRYDVVFDAVGKSSFRRCRPLLTRDGVFLFTDLGFLWHVPILALLTRFSGGRRVILPIPRPEQRDIRLLKDLIASGAFNAVIDRRYPLDAIVDAYRYVDTGEKVGNVVITVA
jgi:NADPH:quinone reductase-like Zn-dependent oxidoreductase